MLGLLPTCASITIGVSRPHGLRPAPLPQLREINIYPGGGNVVLGLPGAEYPLEVSLAGPEALSLVSATGSLEQRRPSTLGTWTRSLLVRRVVEGASRGRHAVAGAGRGNA